MANPPSNERLSRRLTVFQEAVNADLKEATNGIASLSIGIALCPEHGKRYDDLFDAADSALYYVKKHSKDAYQVYNETLQN